MVSSNIQNLVVGGLNLIMMTCIGSGNIRHLIGTFPGPEGSPYQGGHFKVVSNVQSFQAHGKHANS